MAEVIPGFASRFDTPDLLTCFAPRRVLIVSATDDLSHTMLIMWLPPHRPSVLIWAVWRAATWPAITWRTRLGRIYAGGWEGLGKFVEEALQSGVLVTTGALQSKGTRLRLSGGKFTVTDGPSVGHAGE